MKSSSEFPLSQAKSITLSNQTPEHVDMVFSMVVETPGYPEGVLYPVVAWEEKEYPGIWFINALDGFKHIPHVIDRLREHADKVSDIDANLAAGMLNKNDYSWDALVNASAMSDFWKKHIGWAVQECFAQSTSIHWIEYPAASTDDVDIMTHITVNMNGEQRAQIVSDFSEYLKAFSQYNHQMMAKNKKRGKEDGAHTILSDARDNLRAKVESILEIPENIHREDDHGVGFTPKPNLKLT